MAVSWFVDVAAESPSDLLLISRPPATTTTQSLECLPPQEISKPQQEHSRFPRRFSAHLGIDFLGSGLRQIAWFDRPPRRRISPLFFCSSKIRFRQHVHNAGQPHLDTKHNTGPETNSRCFRSTVSTLQSSVGKPKSTTTFNDKVSHE